MGAERMTRRQALAAGFGAIAAGAVRAAPVPKTDPNPSWVGKIVMPKKYAPSGTGRRIGEPPSPDGTPVVTTLLNASYAVKDEKGNQVEIIEADVVCWVEKENLVLLTDAIEFF